VPVATPDGLTIAATVGALLFHIPPGVALPIVVVPPTHSTPAPVRAAGEGNTVMIFVAMQPVVTVYPIVAVPLAIPVTIPVVTFTEALAEPLIMLHVPPADASLNVTLAPSHTVPRPLIAAGVG
jgi:hypothetical protein